MKSIFNNFLSIKRDAIYMYPTTNLIAIFFHIKLILERLITYHENKITENWDFLAEPDG